MENLQSTKQPNMVAFILLLLLGTCQGSAAGTTPSTLPLEFGTVNSLLEGITVGVPPMQLPPLAGYTASQDQGSCWNLGILDGGQIFREHDAVNIQIDGVSFACNFVVTVEKENPGAEPLVIFFDVTIQTSTAAIELDLNITSIGQNGVGFDFGDCMVVAPTLKIDSQRLSGGSSLSFFEEWILLFASSTFDGAVAANVQPFLQNTFCNAYDSLGTMTVIMPQNSQEAAFAALVNSITAMTESNEAIPEMMQVASDYLDSNTKQQQDKTESQTVATSTFETVNVEAMNQLLREKTFNFRESQSYNSVLNVLNGLLGQPESRPAVNIAGERLSAKLGKDDPNDLSLDTIIEYLKPSFEIKLDDELALQIDIRAATLYGLSTFTKYDILRPNPVLNATVDFTFAMDQIGIDVSLDVAVLNKSETVTEAGIRQTTPTAAPTHAPIGMLVLDSIPQGFNDTVMLSMRLKDMKLNASALFALDPDTFSSLPFGGIFKNDLVELFYCVSSALYAAAFSKFELSGQLQQDGGQDEVGGKPEDFAGFLIQGKVYEQGWKLASAIINAGLIIMTGIFHGTLPVIEPSTLVGSLVQALLNIFLQQFVNSANVSPTNACQETLTTAVLNDDPNGQLDKQAVEPEEFPLSVDWFLNELLGSTGDLGFNRILDLWTVEQSGVVGMFEFGEYIEDEVYVDQFGPDLEASVQTSTAATTTISSESTSTSAASTTNDNQASAVLKINSTSTTPRQRHIFKSFGPLAEWGVGTPAAWNYAARAIVHNVSTLSSDTVILRPVDSSASLSLISNHFGFESETSPLTFEFQDNMRIGSEFWVDSTYEFFQQMRFRMSFASRAVLSSDVDLVFDDSLLKATNVGVLMNNTCSAISDIVNQFALLTLSMNISTIQLSLDCVSTEEGDLSPTPNNDGCSNPAVEKLGAWLSTPAGIDMVRTITTEKVLPVLTRVLTDPQIWDSATINLLGQFLGFCDTVTPVYVVPPQPIIIQVAGTVASTLFIAAVYASVHRPWTSPGKRAKRNPNNDPSLIRELWTSNGRFALFLALLGFLAINLLFLHAFQSMWNDGSMALKISLDGQETRKIVPTAQVISDFNYIGLSNIVYLLFEAKSYAFLVTVTALCLGLPVLRLMVMILSLVAPPAYVDPVHRSRLLRISATLGKWSLLLPFTYELVVASVRIPWSLDIPEVDFPKDLLNMEFFISPPLGMVTYLIGILIMYAMNEWFMVRCRVRDAFDEIAENKSYDWSNYSLATPPPRNIEQISGGIGSVASFSREGQLVRQRVGDPYVESGRGDEHLNEQLDRGLTQSGGWDELESRESDAISVVSLQFLVPSSVMSMMSNSSKNSNEQTYDIYLGSQASKFSSLLSPPSEGPPEQILFSIPSAGPRMKQLQEQQQQQLSSAASSDAQLYRLTTRGIVLLLLFMLGAAASLFIGATALIFVRLEINGLVSSFLAYPPRVTLIRAITSQVWESAGDSVVDGIHASIAVFFAVGMTAFSIVLAPMLLLVQLARLAFYPLPADKQKRALLWCERTNRACSPLVMLFTASLGLSQINKGLVDSFFNNQQFQLICSELATGSSAASRAAEAAGWISLEDISTPSVSSCVNLVFILESGWFLMLISWLCTTVVYCSVVQFAHSVIHRRKVSATVSICGVDGVPEEARKRRDGSSFSGLGQKFGRFVTRITDTLVTSVFRVAVATGVVTNKHSLVDGGLDDSPRGSRWQLARASTSTFRTFATPKRGSMFSEKSSKTMTSVGPDMNRSGHMNQPALFTVNASPTVSSSTSSTATGGGSDLLSSILGPKPQRPIRNQTGKPNRSQNRTAFHTQQRSMDDGTDMW